MLLGESDPAGEGLIMATFDFWSTDCSFVNCATVLWRERHERWGFDHGNCATVFVVESDPAGEGLIMATFDF